MNSYKRNGNRWTVNELNSLQREYELLELTVQQIAEKHQRTEKAILYRLESEGFINSWNDARGFDASSYKASIEKVEDCEQECRDIDSEFFGSGVDEEEDEDEDDNELSGRVWDLEMAVTDIKDMVQHLINKLTSSNKKKLKPLRKQMAERH